MGTPGTARKWQGKNIFRPLHGDPDASARAHAGGFWIDTGDAAFSKAGLDIVAERVNAFDKLAKEHP